MSARGVAMAASVLGDEGGRITGSSVAAGTATPTADSLAVDAATSLTFDREAGLGEAPVETILGPLLDEPGDIADLISMARRAGADFGALESAEKILRDVQTGIDALRTFFEQTKVDMGAVSAQASKYLECAQQAHAGQKAGSDACTTLGTWSGEGADAGRRMTTDWTSVNGGAASVYEGMAAATSQAGKEFTNAREAAAGVVPDTVSRIQAAMPSPSGAAGSVGWRILTPSGLMDAAREFSRQVRAFAELVRSEVAGLLQRVVDVSRPGMTAGCAQLGQLAALGEVAARAAACLQTGTDPGPRHHPAGAWPTQVRGSDHQPVDRTFITMIRNYANGDQKAPLPAGWGRVQDEGQLRGMGIDPALLHDDNGFAAYVYKGPDDKLVIVTGGTGSAADAAEDVVGALSYSHQSANAVRLARALQDNGLADNCVFTGHSLGGRLASVAAMEADRPAVTFNAAGVSDPTIAYQAALEGKSLEEYRPQLDSQIRAYRNADDLLTNTQENYSTRSLTPDAVGHAIPLPADPSLHEGFWGWAGNVRGHLSSNVLHGYDQRYPNNS